ncbi:MAG: stage II sporulation protein M [Anaerolineae bacterium]|nr:stage II sporulation protein M [Anaerolineae bacterium]
MNLKTASNHIRRELHPAWVVTRREVRDQFRDWRVIIPIVVLTAFFPYLMNFTVSQILDFVAQYGGEIIGERMIPFLLMIVGFFPISVSLVISLDTFVGEKERGSIEPLLDTPLKNWQLYLGKLLSSTVPPLLGSYLGMGVYLAGLALRGITLPEPAVILIIFTLTTVQALMMVSGAVVVSVQATSVRAANLLASFIIIPSALLIQVESVLMFWGRSVQILWWFVLGLVILSFLLIRAGLSHFQREKLLGREIDVLNFKWILRTFWQALTGKARNPSEWFRISVRPALREMRTAVWCVSALGMVALIVGWNLVKKLDFAIPIDSVQGLNQNLQSMLDLAFFSGASIVMIWLQNLRAVLLTGVLGFLTFGVAGTLPLFATMTLVGYLVHLLNLGGIPMLYLLMMLLPHGLFEIPGLVIGTGAIVHAAAKIITPSNEQTIGEVWLQALAFWLKIILGVCLPLLLIAAVVEAWITPRLLLWLF